MKKNKIGIYIYTDFFIKYFGKNYNLKNSIKQIILKAGVKNQTYFNVFLFYFKHNKFLVKNQVIKTDGLILNIKNINCECPFYDLCWHVNDNKQNDTIILFDVTSKYEILIENEKKKGKKFILMEEKNEQ